MTATAHTHDAEKAILGAILLEPARVFRLLSDEDAKPELFDDPHIRKAVEVAQVLHVANHKIDVLLLAEALQNTPGPAEGWARYFNDCLDNCPLWTNAPEYLSILKDNHRRRRLADLGAKITEAASNGQPADETIEDAIGELQAIQKSNEVGALFESWRLSQIQGYTPAPSNFIAGDGWLRRGAGCLLTGGTGIGKSVLADQISLDVTSGVNILGCIHVKQPCRVLYVQAENDLDTIKRDVEAIVGKSEPKLCPLLIESSFRIAHVYGLGGVEFADWLRRQFDKFKPDLLVIDPYQAFLGGEADINSTACFLSWIRPVNRIIQDAGCALLLVTHTPKPREREGWTARESVYMAAGSSAISNWARTSAELTQAGNDDGRYRLRFGKNAERTGLVDESGRTIRDLFIEHSGSVKEPFWRVSDNQGEPSKSKYRDEIIKCALDHPSMSQRAIADQVGCSIGMVSKWYPRNAD